MPASESFCSGDDHRCRTNPLSCFFVLKRRDNRRRSAAIGAKRAGSPAGRKHRISGLAAIEGAAALSPSPPKRAALEAGAKRRTNRDGRAAQRASTARGKGRRRGAERSESDEPEARAAERSERSRPQSHTSERGPAAAPHTDQARGARRARSRHTGDERRRPGGPQRAAPRRARSDRRTNPNGRGRGPADEGGDADPEKAQHHRPRGAGAARARAQTTATGREKAAGATQRSGSRAAAQGEARAAPEGPRAAAPTDAQQSAKPGEGAERGALAAGTKAATCAASGAVRPRALA